MAASGDPAEAEWGKGLSASQALQTLLGSWNAVKYNGFERIWNHCLQNRFGSCPAATSW